MNQGPFNLKRDPRTMTRGPFELKRSPKHISQGSFEQAPQARKPRHIALCVSGPLALPPWIPAPTGPSQWHPWQLWPHVELCPPCGPPGGLAPSHWHQEPIAHGTVALGPWTPMSLEHQALAPWVPDPSGPIPWAYRWSSLVVFSAKPP